MEHGKRKYFATMLMSEIIIQTARWDVWKRPPFWWFRLWSEAFPQLAADRNDPSERPFPFHWTLKEINKKKLKNFERKTNFLDTFWQKIAFFWDFDPKFPFFDQFWLWKRQNFEEKLLFSKSWPQNHFFFEKFWQKIAFFLDFDPKHPFF